MINSSTAADFSKLLATMILENTNLLEQERMVLLVIALFGEHTERELEQRLRMTPPNIRGALQHLAARKLITTEIGHENPFIRLDSYLFDKCDSNYSINGQRDLFDNSGIFGLWISGLEIVDNPVDNHVDKPIYSVDSNSSSSNVGEFNNEENENDV